MAENLVPTDVPYSSELVSRTVEKLAKQYDFLSVTSAGESVAGSELYVLSAGKGEKELFVNAAHHANEWITTPLALKFLEDYAEAVQTGGELDGISAETLFADTTLYVMPMVNPDGVDLVNGFLKGALKDNAVSIAESYPEIAFPSGWKANIQGTDLNLNYPAGWIKARRLKYAAGFVSPAPRDFVGFYPLSAPESKAVYEYTLTKSFRMVIALHTQGNIIYWKYGDRDPAHAKHIGEMLAAASGYSLELTPEYSSYAGYKDWFIKNYDLPGYTVECGSGVNPLPLADFNGIYADVRPLLTTALHAAATIL